jgi:peroxiredoxin
MKKLFSLFTLMLGLSLLISACGEVSKVATVGMMAPDFTLADRTGKIWTLSELRGQVVFVNFWATWCPPCREEMPSMQRLYSALPKDKFKMLAVLSNDDPVRADAFVAQLGITIPVLHDQDKKVGPKYGLTGLPETFIVDKQGVLREKFIGPAQWDSPRFIQLMMKYISQ